jgi:tRNA(Ile)-lysidine synthase
VIDGEDLIARLRAFAAANTPALAAGRAVLAVSGGADSIAAAALLCEAGVVRAEHSIVAHFDHRLRGDAASAADRAAVEAMCARYGLAFETDAWDDARPGEAAARAARYRFLAAAARRHDIGAVVTGHTADDQAETVVMHALRGAGLHGLAGMAVDGAWPVGRSPLRVWRPLLTTSRAETRAYCGYRCLEYEDDATNADRSFLRNRVRLDLLPRMQAIAPGARDALLQLAGEARAGAAALDAIVGTVLPADDGRDAAGIALPRAALRVLPPAAVPHAFRIALARLLGDARDFGRPHYALLARSVDAATGSSFELPRGVMATVDPSEILLSIGAPRVEAIPSQFAAPLPFVGTVGAWDIAVRPATVDAPGALLLPPDAVVRGRRPGDRLRRRGMRGRKKLQDEYVDRKLPRRLRDAVPVIARGGDVLWTPFAACEPVAGGAPYVIDAAPVAAPLREP